MVTSLVSYDAISGNEINTWVNDSNTQVAVTAVTTATGTSTDWVHTFTPSNIKAGVADGHIKFKNSLELPKGSKV